MKRCPECRRDYYDESLLYCLDDGTALLEGPSSGSEPLTETLPQFELPSEAPTRQHSAAATAEPSISRESIAGTIRGHKGAALAALTAAAIVIAGFGYGIYRIVADRTAPPASAAVPVLEVEPLTASANIREAAISPDGRFLAYTEQSSGKTALFTRQLATNSKIQIADPTAYDFAHLSFSKDGEYVFYILFESGAGSVYQVPTLGGKPTKVLGNVDTGFSLSPDGKQIAAERYDIYTGESAIVIAGADGTGERKLASLTGQEYFSAPSVTWSPDGKLIACGTADDRRETSYALSVVDVSSGEVREFGKRRFDSVNGMVWLNDQSGLFVIAAEKGRNLPRQIWFVSYPEGEARQITQGPSGYSQLSITADSKALVSVQRDSFGGVWFSPSGDINKAEQITRGKQEGLAGISLTTDGRVVYVSNISGAVEIWSAKVDGSDARQITRDGSSKYTPAVTPDGKYIFYIGEKAGRHLWRVNMDGTQATELSKESEDANPQVSPDGKWVVFDSARTGKFAIWRMPVEGGEARQLTDYPALEPDISPDGKFIAAFLSDEQAGRTYKLIVFPFDGGPPLHSFDIPATTFIDASPKWMPDGRGITYIAWTGDSSNIWMQPLDGGPAKQLTTFKQGYIYRREWTPGGKQVAIVRGTETSDAVMLNIR